MSLSKVRTHDCHYEPKTDKKFFTCDGCKMNGFGPRFTCNPCGRELHGECKNPKTHINHEYLGFSTLTFRETPFMERRSKQLEYSKFCDACGKDIRGFSYHCEAGKLDLHPSCANLEKKLCIDGTVFNLGSKVSSKCVWCKKRKISNGGRKISGWSYVSTCGEYDFHVYCMTEMLHEARMKLGNSALEKVDLSQLTKTKRKGGIGRTTLETIKTFLQIIMSVLLGDPTLLISNVLL